MTLCFFSKLIKYEINNDYPIHTFSKNKKEEFSDKIRVGLIGSGDFAISTLIPTINKSKEGYLSTLLGREGLSLHVAKKRFDINTITTDESRFL